MYVPELTPTRRSLAASVVPGDEVDAVYAAYSDILSGWKPSVEPGPVENGPPDPEKLDAAILRSLASLAGQRIVGALAKLCWVSHCVFDPDGSSDWNLSRNRLPAHVHQRVHESSFYLREYRDLLAHPKGTEWLLTMQSPDKIGVFQKARTFPMFGVEHRNGLNNHASTEAWYKEQLMLRGIVKK